tara:strand:+ start:606 stop:878 length:273 start_codon:yes stop_codon:yes gene_type:complete
MSDNKYNTKSARITRPIAIALIVVVSGMVTISKRESFYGHKTDLSNADTRAYMVFTGLAVAWFLYELILSICFFVGKHRSGLNQTEETDD